MTSKRTVHVIATDPDSAQSLATAEKWGRGSTIVWVGDPRELTALGLPDGVYLYEVSIILRYSA